MLPVLHSTSNLCAVRQLDMAADKRTTLAGAVGSAAAIFYYFLSAGAIQVERASEQHYQGDRSQHYSQDRLRHG